MTIERQTRAAPGMIKGPAATSHQVREVTVRIEALPTGGLRVSTTAARGWAAVAKNERELASAIASAFTEAQCAAYAKWRGERYDLDHLTEPVPGDPMAPPRPYRKRRKNASGVGWGANQQRPDTHDVESWVKLPDAQGWQSPNGRVWNADTAVVRRVIARRTELGLPS